MRILVIALSLLAFSATANAATLGDAFQLTENIKVATKQRCPEGKQGDIQSLTAALKCQSIDMGVGMFALKLGQVAMRLMEQCAADLKAGKGSKDCQASNDNYKSVALTGDDEQLYLKLNGQYEAILRDYPVLRR